MGLRVEPLDKLEKCVKVQRQAMWAGCRQAHLMIMIYIRLAQGCRSCQINWQDESEIIGMQPGGHGGKAPWQGGENCWNARQAVWAECLDHTLCWLRAKGPESTDKISKLLGCSWEFRGAKPPDKVEKSAEVQGDLSGQTTHYVGSGLKVLSQLTRWVDYWDAARSSGGAKPSEKMEKWKVSSVSRLIRLIRPQITLAQGRRSWVNWQHV